MHGRKRETEPPSIEVVAALKKKSDTYNSLVNIVFDRRKSNDHSIETLSLCGKMLKNNPDFSTLWNFRREILLTMYSNSIHLLKDIDINYVKISDEIGSKIRDEELNLSAEGIKRNPKSYGAWYHRQWILKRFEVDYKSEFELCKLLLKEDQRNFHCWNYRRFVSIFIFI
jgi:geranylgeranyl transferase type-2 subunit alpha